MAQYTDQRITLEGQTARFPDRTAVSGKVFVYKELQALPGITNQWGAMVDPDGESYSVCRRKETDGDWTILVGGGG